MESAKCRASRLFLLNARWAPRWFPRALAPALGWPAPIRQDLRRAVGTALVSAGAGARSSLAGTHSPRFALRGGHHASFRGRWRPLLAVWYPLATICDARRAPTRQKTPPFRAGLCLDHFRKMHPLLHLPSSLQEIITQHFLCCLRIQRRLLRLKSHEQIDGRINSIGCIQFQLVHCFSAVT